MKTLFKSLMLVAVAAITLVACNKKENPEVSLNNDEIVTLKFNVHNVDNVPLTKAVLGLEDGKNFLDWEDGDQIGTFSTGSFSGGTSASNNNPGTVEVSGDSFTMNIQTAQPGSVAKFYSYYPYSSAAGKEKTAVIVTIPEGQNVTSAGYDADAMPMAGAPVEVDLDVAKANTDTPCGTINFSNLGSIINFKVYSSEATDETLTSVKYVTSGNVGGAFTIDLTGINSSDENTLALTSTDPISAITTTCMTKPAIGTGKSNAVDVYMVVAPGTYANTQVVVTTSSHTYTLTASGEKTYVRSHVKPMYVDIQNGVPGELPKEEVWEKVTKASDFTAGTYYILRGDGKYYLPNAVASGNAPALAAYTEGASISNAMKWNATEGTEGLIFESAAHSGNYLWGGDKNDGVRVNTTSSISNANKEWKFTTVTVEGTTYYTAYAYSTRYLTSYGDQDWRNYTSASKTNIPAEFYKLIDNTPRFSVASPLEATTSEDTYSVNITRSNFTGAITVTVPAECDWVAANDVAENATSFDILVDANTGAARSVTLSLSATGVESQDLVINQAGSEGTAANPYTATQAAAAASGGATGVYVHGIISAITTAYNSTHNNVSFDISDDGLTNSTQFRIYRAAATSADDFKVGDAVTFMGDLTVFNSTPELNAGNTLISQLHAPSIYPDVDSFNTDTQSITLTADAGAEIRYTTDGTTPTISTGSVYSSSAFSIAETTTVKAIAVKDGIITGVVSKSYSKVSSSSVTVEYIFNTDAGLTALGISKPAASDGTELGDSEYTVGAITLTATSGSTATRVWNSNGVTDLRIYKKGAFTFTTSTGNIKSIVLSGGAVGGFSANSGSFSSGTWTGTAKSVTLTATGTEKINTISVTYE